jgi:hypothetical protein
MKTIVLLIGANEAGKTKTLKVFFGVPLTKRLGPLQLLSRVFNGKMIFGVSLSSPQEQSTFCNVGQVKEKVSKRIGKFEAASTGRDYIAIIPFGVYQKNRTSNELNERCIFEPIEWLKESGFRVVPVYLRKESTRLLDEKDSLIRKVAKFEILSNKDYKRQAKELEAIITKLIR